MPRQTEEEANEEFVERETGLSTKKINFVAEYTKDFNITRASTLSGVAPQTGKRWVDHDEMVQAAIDSVITRRREASDIDAQWLLGELVDNHTIARHQGNIPASTQALALIAKHASVDAMASDKVKVEGVTINVGSEFTQV